jgi:hypothetical protein
MIRQDQQQSSVRKKLRDGLLAIAEGQFLAIGGRDLWAMCQLRAVLREVLDEGGLHARRRGFSQ